MIDIKILRENPALVKENAAKRGAKVDVDAIYALDQEYLKLVRETEEMRAERNQNLGADGDRTDFVVASSMSSLCLAQLAESPELVGVFRELLSNRGNELYLKKAAPLGVAGTHSVRRLRARALDHGYVLLGCIRAGESVFNPPLDDELTLDGEDCLIVLGVQ